MSMSTSIVGYRPPDAKWMEMKAVYDSCKKAKIEIPEKVEKFFGWSPPDDAGVEIDLTKYSKEYQRDSQQGIEIELDKIPADVKIIRFVNSW